MKLTIERLSRFTAQDKIDLAKIWPNEDIAALEAKLSPSYQVFAAKFNDRLLGALQAVIDKEWGEGRLLMPLVRQVTRRRGVGLYLLDETQRQLPDINHWWLSHDQPVEDMAIMDHFMTACGFSRESDGWHKRR
ncbi:aspartate 1-decarboxylase autocleavage activator PanM [Martelella alba]|uniref:Aspartate 1-decarboxylase autocleavage activator PanM n=1 Tax=Martelella alba TaxID=2590451 RepID=A0ABY2SMW1_9HYPH|nr:aspartate 1-decarboxylase autocleavage activator PanM [Martelella alba]TKI07152.1 aspartate 1-decarboxylase autocleavage activator PanM [Martelella alba]